MAEQDTQKKVSGGGVMVALYIPMGLSRTMAVDGGEAAETLHVTLAYVKGVGSDPLAMRRMAGALRPVAMDFAEVQGWIGGIGRFNGSETSGGKDVFYASYNSPVLPVLQQAVVKALEAAGFEVQRSHGFTPHVTLKYLEPDEALPLSVAKSDPFYVPAISLASKSLPRMDLLLTGDRVLKQAPASEENRLKSAIFDTIMNYLNKALGLVAGEEVPEPPEMTDLQVSQRLIEGMDYEMRVNGVAEAVAQDIAAVALEADPLHYWKLIMGTDDLGDMHDGLSIDLGCGNGRLPGFMGFDRYPYDFATVVCDLKDGIPLPAACVSQAMMQNSLTEIGPQIMDELARVMQRGGAIEAIGFDEPLEPNDYFVVDAIEQADGAPTRQRLTRTDAGMADVQILKSSKPMQQIVYGVILTPDEVDIQDDFMTAEDIEKTAHQYLVESRVLGALHIRTIKADVVESYIAPVDIAFEGGQYGPQLVKKGSWVIGARIRDPKEWQKVVDGDYQGFSVGGLGVRLRLHEQN